MKSLQAPPWLLALTTFTFLLGCATTPESDDSGEAAAPLEESAPPAASRSEFSKSRILASARFAAVGDLLMHGAVKESASAASVPAGEGRPGNNGGYDVLFEGVAASLRDSDLAFANLETPIAPTTNRGSRPFVFDAPPALLPALRSMGIGIVSFANNHVYDQGRPGFEETLDQLEQAGLPYVGAGRSCEEAASAKLLEVGGLQVAFLATTKVFNSNLNRGPNEACAAELDEARTIEEIRRIRGEGAELVILSIHWGVEYSTAPRQQEIDQAHRLLEAGADAILGHHPHVLQPIEVYLTEDGRHTFVAYSLGNFISNQSRTYVHGLHPEKMGNTRDGVIVRFRGIRRQYADGLVRAELADLVAEPLWTENDAVERKSRKSKDAPRIRVVHTDSALAAAREALAGTQTEEERLALQQRVELLEARRAAAGAILGEDFLP